MEVTLRKHALSAYAVKSSAKGRPTLNTDSVEISDPDEFRMNGPTKLTETIESSDEDEFLLM